MKALKFFMIVFLPGVFLSCHKKKYPDPVVMENHAVYYSQLTIDNMPVRLEAGVDGYYMYSSYKLDSSFVYGFIADLRKRDCSSCTNSLKIQINDYKVSLSGLTSIDSSLRADQYPLLAGNPEASYAMQFFPMTPAISYFWDFGDGNNSSEPSPVHIYDTPGKYNVCLKTTGENYCMSSICSRQKIDLSSKSCKASITANTSSANAINFSATVKGGQSPYQYLWSFGDGATSTEKDPFYSYKYRGAYAVSLRVVDALGDTAYANYNAKTASDNSSCAANYSVSDVSKVMPNPALSQVIITWTDANGTVYTSNNTQQPGESSFEILSVSENERNEIGQPTKKISARFKCKLYNGGKSIEVNNAEVVICVAYNN